MGGAPGSISQTGMEDAVSVTLGDRSDDFLHSCIFLDNPFPKDKSTSSDAQTGMDGYQDSGGWQRGHLPARGWVRNQRLLWASALVL